MSLTPEQRIEKKVSLAKERDTRVVITRTVDTMRILDIVKAADRGIKKLRSNLLISYKTDEVVPLLDEYQKTVEMLHLVTARICDKVGIPYRPPRGLDLPPAVGDSKEAKEQKHVETLIDAAFSGDDGKKKRALER